MSEQPYYGPNASAEEIFYERTFVAGDLVTGIGYGIQIVLYTSCATYLWGQRNSQTKKTSILLLAYMTFLLIVETIFVAVQARTVQDIYVDNRNFPGGPWAYFLATQDKAINVIFYATLFVLTFLSDLLVLWRCWVIWRASGSASAYGAVAFPILMLIGSFVMGTLWTLQSSRPGLSLYSALPRAYGMSYFFISLSVNIILTILITGRLLIYRRTAMKSLPEEHGREYYSLATIIVESAAVYSAFAVLFIVTYSIDNPINQVCLAFASSAQQIAGYWIIYRIAQGKAWTRSTLSQAPSPKPARVHDSTIEFFSIQHGTAVNSVFQVTSVQSDLEPSTRPSITNVDSEEKTPHIEVSSRISERRGSISLQ